MIKFSEKHMVRLVNYEIDGLFIYFLPSTCIFFQLMCWQTRRIKRILKPAMSNNIPFHYCYHYAA